MNPADKVQAHRRHGLRFGHPLALAGLLALAGCAGIDGDRARLCRIAIPALEPPGTQIRIERIRAAEQGVRVEYRTSSDTAPGRARFAQCRFALGRRAEIEAIRTDRGDVPGATVYLLRRYYVETPDGAAADPGPPSPETNVPEWPRPAAILAQSLAAGAPGAAILALLAASYSLFWGMAARADPPVAPIAVVGAAAVGVGAWAAALGSFSILGLAAALALGIGAAALHGRTAGRRGATEMPGIGRRASLAAIAAIAMALSDHPRLAAGKHGGWNSLTAPGGMPVARSGDIVVTILPAAIAITLIALLAAIGVLTVMRRTRFGLRWAAGADRRPLIRQALLLASAVACLASALSALPWGALGFSGGLSLGLKAIAGAILGGIASVPAALAGGLLLGLTGSLWQAFLPTDWNIALFIALTVAIMLRPSGLFARS